MGRGSISMQVWRECFRESHLKRGALGFCCVTHASEEIVIRLIKCSHPADFTPSLWHSLFILSKGDVVDVLVSSLWYLAGWLCVWHRHADGDGSHHVLHQLLGAEVSQTGTRWVSLHAFTFLWSQEMHSESITNCFYEQGGVCTSTDTHTPSHMHACVCTPPTHTHTHAYTHTYTTTTKLRAQHTCMCTRTHIHHLSLWFELFAFTFSDKTFREFSDVCGHFLGRFAKLLATFSSLVTLLGGAIVYWILLSNFLYNIVIFIYSKSAFCLRTGCVKFMLHCMINCVWVSKCLCVCVTTLYVCVCVFLHVWVCASVCVDPGSA